MNTKVNFCGVEFENPVVTGSGTFGFGYEYSQYYNLHNIVVFLRLYSPLIQEKLSLNFHLKHFL